MESGIVYNIQRMSTKDGPGLRTTVFLKGCPLRCLWCSNPESQAFQPQLMCFENLCVSCGACAQVCPRRVIELIPRSSRVHVFCKSQDNGATVRKYCSKGCIGCRLCVKNAAEGVIIVDGTLARVNHSIPFDGDAALEKCPTKCLRRD